MRIALVGAECEENLALRYIRAALEARGHHVTQITFNAETDTEAAAEQLAQSGAGLAGFSMVFTYRAAEFAELARRSRKLGFHGHLVAGGHFAAFNAEALLRDVPAFDSVAVGEGEELMCELAVRLESLGEVRGLVWRDGGGMIHRNTAAVKPPDLDRLPYPTRMEPPDTYLGLPVANMLGSRGCTHGCAFCSIAAWHRLCGGARLRLREPGAVAEEMAGLYARGYQFLRGLGARVRGDNQRFTVQAARLVQELSLTAQPRLRRSGMWQQDAAAVLASSLTLAAASGATHMCEVAARPPSSVTTQMVVDPPPPPIITLANRQKAILQEKVLPNFAALLAKPAPLKMRAVFGDHGQWNSGEVFNPEARKAVTMPPTLVSELIVPELKSTLCEASFTKEEVAAARNTPAAGRAILKRELGQGVMTALLADLNRPSDVDLTLTISKEGRFDTVRVLRLRAGQKPTVVTNLVHTQSFLASVRIQEPMLRGKAWTLRCTAAELAAAGIWTHPTEMAPLPRRTEPQRPPSTHMHEMAPVPRQDR